MRRCATNRTILRALAALCLATALAPAQSVLFAEHFAAGMPSAWTHLALGIPMDPWTPGTSPATSSPDVFHEWFCNHGGLNRNNVLVTPAIDLTGFTRADFSCVQHQMFPLQRSVNRVEVSTDGGSTFAVMYDETGTWSGPGTITFSLDAYAGLPDVRIGFHYEGAVANEWRIDDVLVTTPQPVLGITGLVAGGTATFAATGNTPGSLVVFALSLTGGGPLPSPFGPIGLMPPIGFLPLQIADANGAASTTLAIPPAATGVAVYAQAAEFALAGTVRLSNWRHTSVP